MKKTNFLLVLVYVMFLVGCTSSEDKTPNEIKYAAIDQRVEQILSTLTLEDKCGEMTQLNLDMVCVGEPYNLEKPNRLDSAKLRKVLIDLKVGSILNQGGQAYSREKWFELINEIQRVATQEKKSKIPVLYGIDAIHGVNYTTGNSLFPQQIGLAATWNTELAYEMGCISAYETRASNIPWTFSPVLDLARDARWPRHWETFGEDPLLASDMGENVIKGYEGDDVSSPYNVASCLKHFLGYSVTLTGKDRTQAWVPERQMREYFLPTFKRAIDAGAKTLMVNSGEMNGIPVHANHEILTTLLRDELGFEGLVVTDWEDIKYLRDRHRVAKDYKEAIKLAIDAGIDMSMVPVDYDFPVLLKELVEDGEIKESRLDESVRRILKLKIQLGLFENPVMNFDDYPDFGSVKHADAALNTARESITLLKNNNQTLPLRKERILLVGPLTDNLNALIGGWGRTWQGVDSTYNNPTKKTIFEAFVESDKLEVVHHETSLNPDFKEIYKAVLKTKGIKTAVICMGEMPYTETVGDIEDMNLPEGQYELVKQISEAVDNLIIVLVEGRPRIISQIEPLADAIVQAYLPGNEGAQAILDVVTGEINPSGKLPYTYPRYASSHSTYDHKTTDLIDPKFGLNAFQPQYEFGYGLSYTDFAYSNLSISSDSISCGDSLTVSIDVKNTGGLAGKEVVQLYIRDEVASITPAVKMLKGYTKIDLSAGETRLVQFNLTCQDLEFVGIEMERITEEGDYTLMVDTLRMPFYLK